jgi:hypothetical protein
MEFATALLRVTDCVDRIDRLQVVLEMARDMNNYEPNRAYQYESVEHAQVSYCLILLDTYDKCLTEAMEDLRETLRQLRESVGAIAPENTALIPSTNPTSDRNSKKLALIAN